MIVVAGLALILAAPSERWVEIGSGAAHRDYLDRDSIERAGDRVTLWTRRDFATERRTRWHEMEVDCSRRQDTLLAWVEDHEGSVSHNVTRPARGPAPIADGSLAARIYDAVCR